MFSDKQNALSICFILTPNPPPKSPTRVCSSQGLWLGSPWGEHGFHSRADAKCHREPATNPGGTCQLVFPFTQVFLPPFTAARQLEAVSSAQCSCAAQNPFKPDLKLPRQTQISLRRGEKCFLQRCGRCLGVSFHSSDPKFDRFAKMLIFFFLSWLPSLGSILRAVNSHS